MPSWNELLNEIKNAGSTHDLIRRKYLAELHKQSRRTVVVCYSGWLQKSELQRQGFVVPFQLNDADKNGFMSTIHGLDRNLGLDLILHTPGAAKRPPRSRSSTVSARCSAPTSVRLCRS